MAEREEQGLAKSALIPTSGNRFNYEGSPRLTIQQVLPPLLPPPSIETHGHAYTCTGVDARVHQDPFRPSPALSFSPRRGEERGETKSEFREKWNDRDRSRSGERSETMARVRSSLVRETCSTLSRSLFPR